MELLGWRLDSLADLRLWLKLDLAAVLKVPAAAGPTLHRDLYARSQSRISAANPEGPPSRHHFAQALNYLRQEGVFEGGILMRGLFAVLLLLLGACVSTSTTQLPLHPGNDNEAIVHIIRGSVVPYLYGLEVSVDGKPAAVVANQSFSSFSVPVGEHTFFLQWPKGTLQKDTAELARAFKGRETRYFLVAKDDLERPGLVDPATATVLLTRQLSRLPLKLMELEPEAGKGLMEKIRAQEQK